MLTRFVSTLSVALLVVSPLYAQTNDALADSAPLSVTHPDSSKPVPDDEARLNDVLKHYVGRWVGNFEIRSLNRVIQTIEIEQQYWWADIDGNHVLKGQAVLAAQGTLSTSSSLTYIENGRIYSIAEQDGNEHFYVAKVNEDGKRISWMPGDDTDPLSRKVTDTFDEGPEGSTLIIEGYEEVAVGNNRALVTMRGVLKKTSDEAAPDSPAQPTED